MRSFIRWIKIKLYLALEKWYSDYQEHRLNDALESYYLNNTLDKIKYIEMPVRILRNLGVKYESKNSIVYISDFGSYHIKRNDAIDTEFKIITDCKKKISGFLTDVYNSSNKASRKPRKAPKRSRRYPCIKR